MKRIMIIAGEASGDLHAAKLVKAVHGMAPDIRFFGIGGHNMRAAGVDTLVDSKELAVVGLVEIWAHRKVIFGALDLMREKLAGDRPDMLILVDYPEFNMRLAKTAKQLGIKVFYYISPQVWAWRQHRVKTIRKRVDMMAVVFPFEEKFYHEHQVPVRFVGHPLVDEVKPGATLEIIRQDFKLASNDRVIGLFPGSRRSEVRRLLPILLQSAALLQKDDPHIRFLLPLASSLDENDITPYLRDYPHLDIQVIQQRTYDVIAACELIITVSGTVTLEIALLGTPLIIINKVNWLTYLLFHRMLKIDHIGLCNIVANKRVAPELIQHHATAEKIYHTARGLLTDKDARETMRRELGKIEAQLGTKGGIDTAARLVLEVLRA